VLPGWRLDVMGDTSFPTGYWESFRQATKQTKPDALIIASFAERQHAVALSARRSRRHHDELPLPRCCTRLAGAAEFRRKGFADSGRKLLPSEFSARLQSIREDYPDAAYYSLMNLLGSHDTARLLWVLTPGRETVRRRN